MELDRLVPEKSNIWTIYVSKISKNLSKDIYVHLSQICLLRALAQQHYNYMLDHFLHETRGKEEYLKGLECQILTVPSSEPVINF